jgi:hypothetical protein
MIGVLKVLTGYVQVVDLYLIQVPVQQSYGRFCHPMPTGMAPHTYLHATWHYFNVVAANNTQYFRSRLSKATIQPPLVSTDRSWL